MPRKWRLADDSIIAVAKHKLGAERHCKILRICADTLFYLSSLTITSPST